MGGNPLRGARSLFPWSGTNSLFREVSGLLGPLLDAHPPFNADWPLLTWPLDHVFFDSAARDCCYWGDAGSDHFPFFVALCHAQAAADVQEQPPPESFNLDAAEEVIEEGRRRGIGMRQ